MSFWSWLVIALVVVVAALRSTWSPCGLSMLSTITPLAEAGRGRRYGVTAAWFVVAAGVGGAALGALGAIGAAVVESMGLAAEDRVLVALVVVAVAAGFDADLVSPRLPHHRRQVNEVWLDQFRGWVYGAGFGVQIGAGLATYIMTAAVYLVVVLGALSARPWAAVGLGVAFGSARGLAVLAGASVTTPERLVTLHRRLDAWREPVRVAVVAVELVAAVAFAVQTSRPALALGGFLAAAAATWAVSRSRTVLVLPPPATGPATGGPVRSRVSGRSPLS